MIFYRVCISLILASVSASAFAGSLSCNQFSIRPVFDGITQPDENFKKMKVTQPGYEWDEIWVDNEILLDASSLEKVYASQSKPVFTPEMMAKIKADPRAVPGLPGMEEAFTTSHPEVVIVFKQHAKMTLQAITRTNVGKRLAIVLDGNLIMAPQVFEPISGGEVKISGISSEEEANKIANRLNELVNCK